MASISKTVTPGRAKDALASRSITTDDLATARQIAALEARVEALQARLENAEKIIRLMRRIGPGGTPEFGGYYQTLIDSDSGDMPQRAKADFSHEFKLTDSGPDATFIENKWAVFTEGGSDVVLTSSWTHCGADATLGPGGNYDVTLPVSSGHIGRMVNVVKIDSTVNTVTVNVQGGDTLNVPAGLEVLSAQWDNLCVIAVAGGWEIVSSG